MRRALSCLVALLALLPAAAFACGGPETCRTAAGTYRAELPAGPPVGAVLILHGWGGTAEGELGNRAIVEPLLARGYAVIAPAGLPFRPEMPKGSWNAAADPANRDDVAFVAEVADDAAQRFAIPRGRMILAGFSLGGMMVWRAACDAPGAFAAFAPVAGTFWRPVPETCVGPLRLLHAHGFSDPVVPIEGRPLRSGQIEQGDVFRALDLARAVSGCPKDSPDAYSTSGEFQVRSWTACAPGVTLAFALHPGGHWVSPDWPALLLGWFEGSAAPVVACRAGTASGTC